MIHNLNKVPAGVVECAPSGSRYICEPAPMDTDEDYVVLVQDPDHYVQCLMEDGGWDLSLDIDYDGCAAGEEPFFTARKAEVNLIIYTSRRGYDLFCLATEVCRTMNLLEKKDRIAVFKVVCSNSVRW